MFNLSSRLLGSWCLGHAVHLISLWLLRIHNGIRVVIWLLIGIGVRLLHQFRVIKLIMVSRVVLIRVERFSLLSVRLFQMVISVHLFLVRQKYRLCIDSIVMILAMIDRTSTVTT